MSSSGGLIQITNYGSHDIMLTNNPEITFFKLIYRRYTNFGKMFIEQRFDNPIGFGQTSVLDIPKAYDLLSNLILKIKLPILDLKFINDKIKKDNNEKLKIYNKYYTLFLNFKLQLQNIVNNYFNDLVSPNSNYITDLDILIRDNITERQYNVFFEIVDYFFNSMNITSQNANYYKNASLYKLVDDVLTYNYENLSVQNVSLDMFQNLINVNMELLDELNKILYDVILSHLNNNSKISLEWIDKIAIYMFEFLEINIGSNNIVRLFPDYIDTYGQLTYRNEEIYNYMINNRKINESIKFFLNKSDADNYVYLPVPFWFCQTYGLAVPLIALQFNNFQFRMRINNYFDLLKITYTDDLEQKFVENIINIYKEEILVYIEEQLREQLNITVLLEYVSLDSIERQKFVQAGHEYLITQNQMIEFTDATPLNNKFNINFFHCVKELWWFVSTKRPNNDLLIGNDNEIKYYKELDTKQYSCKSDDYINFINSLFNPFEEFNTLEFMKGLTIYENKIINNVITNEDFINDINYLLTFKLSKIPYCKASSIIFNSVTFIDQTYKFFNYLQPYKAYNSTPVLGTNVFSFSLFPTDFQPSGSVNLGRIPAVNLRLELLQLNNIKNNDNNEEFLDYIVRIYGTNYNVLRIIGGIAGLAYQY